MTYRTFVCLNCKYIQEFAEDWSDDNKPCSVCGGMQWVVEHKAKEFFADLVVDKQEKRVYK